MWSPRRCRAGSKCLVRYSRNMRRGIGFKHSPNRSNAASSQSIKSAASNIPPLSRACSFLPSTPSTMSCWKCTQAVATGVQSPVTEDVITDHSFCNALPKSASSGSSGFSPSSGLVDARVAPTLSATPSLPLPCCCVKDCGPPACESCINGSEFAAGLKAIYSGRHGERI